MRSGIFNTPKQSVSLTSLGSLLVKNEKPFKRNLLHSYYLILGTGGLRESILDMENKPKDELINPNINILIGGDNSKTKEAILNYSRLRLQRKTSLSNSLKRYDHVTHSFCECPNFIYQGKIEEQLSKAISIEMAVKFALTIRGNVIVLDYSDFFANDANKYHYLMETLRRLFGDNCETIFKSSIFLIANTGNNKNAEQDIFNAIKEENKKLTTFLKDLKPCEVREAKQFKLTFGESLVTEPDKLILLTSENRTKIMTMLLDLKSLQPNQFNFHDFYSPLLKKVDNCSDVKDFIEAFMSSSLHKIKLSHSL